MSASTSLKETAFSALMAFFKVIHCVVGGDLDREGSSISISKTEEAQAVVGHGVAKHERRRW